MRRTQARKLPISLLIEPEEMKRDETTFDGVEAGPKTFTESGDHKGLSRTHHAPQWALHITYKVSRCWVILTLASNQRLVVITEVDSNTRHHV